MIIVIKESFDELSKAVAKMIVDRIRLKPALVLGLATGSTPLGVYKELIRYHKEEGVDFSKVITFNLDEYVGLKPQHDQSYYFFMWENLFKHINVNPSNVHIPSFIQGYFPQVKSEDDYETDAGVVSFCRWYEERIRSAGGIDIQLLGVGTDGHIAFNEPGSSLQSRTRVVNLLPQTIKDNARFFNSDLNLVPKKAVTMGVGTILSAKEIILMAGGKGKAHAINRAVEGPLGSLCPASVVQWHEHAYVMIDTPAAAELSEVTVALARKNPPAPVMH